MSTQKFLYCICNCNTIINFHNWQKLENERIWLLALILWFWIIVLLVKFNWHSVLVENYLSHRVNFFQPLFIQKCHLKSPKLCHAGRSTMTDLQTKPYKHPGLEMKWDVWTWLWACDVTSNVDKYFSVTFMIKHWQMFVYLSFKRCLMSCGFIPQDSLRFYEWHITTFQNISKI